WLVPVRNRKSHRRFGDKVYRVAEVSRDPRGRLAALLHLDTRNTDSAHTFFDQVWLQRRAGEAVTRVFDHYRLIFSCLEKVHQLERGAVSGERLVAVSM